MRRHKPNPATPGVTSNPHPASDQPGQVGRLQHTPASAGRGWPGSYRLKPQGLACPRRLLLPGLTPDQVLAGSSRRSHFPHDPPTVDARLKGYSRAPQTQAQGCTLAPDFLFLPIPKGLLETPLPQKTVLELLSHSSDPQRTHSQMTWKPGGDSSCTSQRQRSPVCQMFLAQ